MFTDVGYRLRVNNFNMVDYWFWSSQNVQYFEDIVKYNFDTFTLRKDNNQPTKAEVYIRLSTDMITHSRRVMLLFDFLGKIGGLHKLLLTIATIITGFAFGDRLALEIMENIYKLRDNGEDVPNFKSRDVLMKNLSCFYRSKRTKQLDKALVYGRKKLGDLFDLRT